MTEPNFWTCVDGEEILRHETRDEAIEAYLDDCFNVPAKFSDLPETVTLHGFSPMKVSVGSCGALESMLESLDEEYANPDGDPTKPTEKMRTAEAAFIAVVESEYVPWMCEEVASEEVNVMEWVKEHRPDWLT